MDTITNKEELLEVIKKGVWNLQYASEELKDDKEVILEAVKKYGCNLKYASERLQNDKEFLKEIEKI